MKFLVVLAVSVLGVLANPTEKTKLTEGNVMSLNHFEGESTPKTVLVMMGNPEKNDAPAMMAINSPASPNVHNSHQSSEEGGMDAPVPVAVVTGPSVIKRYPVPPIPLSLRTTPRSIDNDRTTEAGKSQESSPKRRVREVPTVSRDIRDVRTTPSTHH